MLFLSRDVVREALAAVAAVPRFACSIMPCTDAEIADVATDATDLSGDAGLSGEMGRAIMLLIGDAGAMEYSLPSGFGNVREFCDLGDNTAACLTVREAARVAAPALPRFWFLRTERASRAAGAASAADPGPGAASFSLSEAI